MGTCDNKYGGVSVTTSIERTVAWCCVCYYWLPKWIRLRLLRWSVLLFYGLSLDLIGNWSLLASIHCVKSFIQPGVFLRLILAAGTLIFVNLITFRW